MTYRRRNIHRQHMIENESLVADLIEFISHQSRTYVEVMDAWRTSCPRLTIWEDAVDNRFIMLEGCAVIATEEGKRFLEAARNMVPVKMSQPQKYQESATALRLRMGKEA